MGFFTILKSVEELLYEIMSWIVFYPRTLWKVIRHPTRMIDYSDHEQKDRADQQYTDMLSPPIFLMLTIFAAHALELAFHSADHRKNDGIAAMIGSSEENVLILLVLLFSIYPLMYAVGLLKRSDRPLDRDTLRAPFFSQCYLGALFALLVTISSIMFRSPERPLQIAGLSLSISTAIWYVWIQSIWFSEHLKVNRIKGVGIAFRTLIKATLINGLLSSLFFV